MPRLNLPPVERLIRVLLGLTTAAYGLLATAESNVILVALGLCVALTGLVGFCPACALAGGRLRPKP